MVTGRPEDIIVQQFAYDSSTPFEIGILARSTNCEIQSAL